ncbi:PREDICTED: uncharacterized protein LOC101807786 [Ficedula albicollis]|uniref:uncharacterized protein LOC101807786 n=1 Tax=Ficedula albicollis TaxID=59894 RepID=UPI000359E9EC|nr:PREDICTED: uncharacterized protein LOC101807786 [Ficedula albicollis]
MGVVWGRSKTVRALVRAPGAGSWWRCLRDGDAKGAACVWLCMWGSGQGTPPACLPFGDPSEGTKEGEPTLPSLPPLGLAHGEEGLVLLPPQPGSSPALPQEAVGKALPSPGSAGAAELATFPAQGASKGALRPLPCPGRWGWVEEQSSAFFPGSGSGFPPRLGPSAAAGETGASLSASAGPGAVALRERARRSRWHGNSWGGGAGVVLGAGGEGHWVSAAVGSPLLVSPGVLCARGRAEAGLGCCWCALELGAEPRGRGLSAELAGPSFSGCLAT